jgi:hypothetical protein
MPRAMMLFSELSRWRRWRSELAEFLRFRIMRTPALD